MTGTVWFVLGWSVWILGLAVCGILDCYFLGLTWKRFRDEKHGGWLVLAAILLTVPVFVVLWAFGLFNIIEYVKHTGWWSLLWLAAYGGIGLLYMAYRGLRRLRKEVMLIRKPVFLEMKAAMMKALAAQDTPEEAALREAFRAADNLTPRFKELRFATFGPEPEFQTPRSHSYRHEETLAVGARQIKYQTFENWFRDVPQSWEDALRLLKEHKLPAAVLSEMGQLSRFDACEIWEELKRASQFVERFELFQQRYRELSGATPQRAWEAFKATSSASRINVAPAKAWLAWLILFWPADMTEHYVLRVFDHIMNGIRAIVRFCTTLGQKIANWWMSAMLGRV